MHRHFLRALLPFLLLTMSACSPGYVVRAAYEEGKILWNREDIDEALIDPEVPQEQKDKLQIVKDARLFSETLSLTPHDSFTQYSLVDRDVLVWVVMASEKDSFTLHGWWFPIVGTVPYKGFFEKEDAIDTARELAAQGYETWVRGADAFSTLGWFNDPVLSTTLRHSVPEIVETVIHEIVHSTIWIPNHVDFNESLANFLGMRGSLLFFQDKVRQCKDDPCRQEHLAHLKGARSEFDRAMELSGLINKLYDDLDTLYKSERTKEEKISEREKIFLTHIGPYRSKYPTMKALQSVNNAEIMQLKLYFTELDLFDTLYRATGENFDAFMKEIEAIKGALADKEDESPFEITRRLVQNKHTSQDKNAL